MMSPATFSFSDLLLSLREIEDHFLREDRESYSDLVARLAIAQKNASLLCNGIDATHESVEQVRQASRRIQVIARTRLDLDNAFGDLCQKVRRDANVALEEAQCKQQVQALDLSETLPSYHMRKHFLANLHDPYPTAEDKEAMVRATNEATPSACTPPSKRTSIDINQLTLWFINARRRSGWSQISRKFARNDRNRMKLLVQAKLLASDPSVRATAAPSVLIHSLDDILRENLGHLTPADKKEFEDDWNSMISWIKYGVKEKVGDWVYDLVAANKKSPPKSGQARAVTTAANRSPARKTPTKAQVKPRQAKQRPSKTPSDDSISGLESTPELSMCSTADTSFSSFNSNTSMAQYDPFHKLQQSPSLNTKGGRKVKALPKRAAKLSAEALYTNNSGTGLTCTCFPVPEERKSSLSLAAEALAHVSGQTTSYPAKIFPPYDALGQAPFVPRRESLSSNSLSAAFG